MTALILVIALGLIFDLVTGIHDSSNVVSTVISSRAMPPRLALLLTAVAELIGPFLFGVAVAKTIGSGIAPLEVFTIDMVLAGLVGAIVWSLITWFFGIPSSSSHALVGGLLGPILVGPGLKALNGSGLAIVAISLFTTPTLGFFGGYILTKLVLFLARNATLKINRFFQYGQLVSAFILAMSAGANDAQKIMGVITLALVAGGYLSGFQVPFWVTAASAGVLALGTGIGGWRMIKTVGNKFYKIRLMHGFNAQISSALVVLTAGIFGGPVSTTQIASTSVLGVGAADRMNQVRWIVVWSILLAWVLTIPIAALISAVTFSLIQLF